MSENWKDSKDRDYIYISGCYILINAGKHFDQLHPNLMFDFQNDRQEMSLF